MKVSRLVIKNFQGVSELDVRPEDLNLIAGRNGAGKTSLLAAITAAVTSARGEKLRLVRDDAGEALVLLELDDGYTVRREVEDVGGRTAGPVTVIDGTGREVNAAQKFLSAIGAGFGFDPLAFVALPPQEQTKRLLELVHTDLPVAELIKLGGGMLPEVDYTRHPLQVLTALIKALEEHRRIAGRDARDTEGMVTKLRASVPTDFNPVVVQGFDLAGAYATLQRRDETAHQMERAKARVDEVFGKLELVRRQVADLEQQQALAESQWNEAQQALSDLCVGTDFEALKERIRTYEIDRQHLAALRDAEAREQQAAELREQYATLADRIEQARNKPGEILATAGLPIEGLGVNDDGFVTVNGRPFSQLSTGEQLRAAVDVAVATLGDLKVVLIDGFERLDEDGQHDVIEHLRAAGVQAFIAQVADSDLTIVSLDDEDGDEIKSVDGDDIPF